MLNLKVAIFMLLGSPILEVLCICEFPNPHESGIYSYDNYYKTVEKLKEHLTKANLVDESMKWNPKNPWNLIFAALQKRIESFHGKVIGEYSLSRRGLDMDTYYKLQKVIESLEQWRAKNSESSLKSKITKSATEKFVDWLGANMI